MRSTIKISLTAVFALALVLALVAFLNVLRFHGALSTITAARVDVIVDEVQQSLEAALDLGLPLADMATATDILARARTRDERIETVAVFDADGRILFSVGSALPPASSAWNQIQARTASDGRWSIEGEATTIFGHRLDSSYAQGVGGVAVVYSNAVEAARVATVRDSILQVSVLIFAVFGAIAVAVTVLALGDLRRLVTAVARGLGGDKSAALPGDLAQSIDGFRAAVAEAEGELGAAEADLGREMGPAHGAAAGGLRS